MASSDGKKSRWRWQLKSERLSRWANWATIVAVPIAVLALVVTLLSAGGNGSATPDPGGASSASLQQVGLAVRNDVSLDEMQGLEVLLHNAGGQRSVVSGARIEILRVDPLPLCFSQGDLQLSGHYDAQLSTDAEPGDVVEVPLHQQLGSDEADRFEIALGLSGEEESSSSDLYLFELDVSLEHDGAQPPVGLGRALVSLPMLPPPGAYYWARDTGSSLKRYMISGNASVQETWGPPMSCWLANTETLRRVLAGSAARSPQMDAIGSDIVTPTFAALE